MTDEAGIDWIDCAVNDDYEISTTYPYQIRCKIDKWIVGESVNGTGYVVARIGGKLYYKHRVIALQFIANDDPIHKSQIDHIDGCKTNNHISNLRWCSRCDNMRNQNGKNGKPFVFIDKLPETSEPLTSYNQHQFESLYIDRSTQKLYLFNGARIKLLEPIKSTFDYRVRDVEGRKAFLSYNKLFD